MKGNISFIDIFSTLVSWGGVRRSLLDMSIVGPRMMYDDESGAVDGMIDRGD
jgi:hypothetical protein